ncbi:MAG: HD domain-containing protein [Erysipelotrichaceae bacterium]|nr:HD domain-containing protein [Erysipelotrichaceae bacterium]
MNNRKDREAEEILKEIKNDIHVQRMKTFLQHGRISTYKHCENVARTSDRLDRIFRLHADREVLLKGAMLHDFFLYDWHEPGHGLHGLTHPEKAARNAGYHLQADERIQHVIRSHMWPLTLRALPRSREAWIVCIADKFESLKETLFER